MFNRIGPGDQAAAAATEDDHLALLGLLNSSTACFWMKQVFHNKGSSVDQHGAVTNDGHVRELLEFDANQTETASPSSRVARPPTSSHDLADASDGQHPASVLPAARETCPVTAIAESKMAEVWPKSIDPLAAQMISLQEELDWQCYRLYGLIEDDLTQSRKAAKEDANESDANLPAAAAASAWAAGLRDRDGSQDGGRRAARRPGSSGTASTPITELPADWPDDYRKLVERRIELIESDPNIRLIEQPEYKRRWNTEPWESQLERALARLAARPPRIVLRLRRPDERRGKPTARLRHGD